ncbi:hypothetical protein Gogos_003869 [Gossypium gossypioides]|uniref:Uncharacterized protein n=1 Tax=Gossypium gossypioides TaxID=34282 RepID=A0A7J9CNK9_GOSGO|nr:hypothetical protein [Gossypium gossypioides]
MATATVATTVTLKLLIDTIGKRVLYTRAGNFVDFLFNILLLLVDYIIGLLTKECMVGCLRNLYGNVENLGDAYILLKTNKDTLLKPKHSSSFAVEFLLVAKHGIINNTGVLPICI